MPFLELRVIIMTCLTPSCLVLVSVADTALEGEAAGEERREERREEEERRRRGERGHSNNN